MILADDFRQSFRPQSVGQRPWGLLRHACGFKKIRHFSGA